MGDFAQAQEGMDDFGSKKKKDKKDKKDEGARLVKVEVRGFTTEWIHSSRLVKVTAKVISLRRLVAKTEIRRLVAKTEIFLLVFVLLVLFVLLFLAAKVIHALLGLGKVAHPGIGVFPRAGPLVGVEGGVPEVARVGEAVVEGRSCGGHGPGEGVGGRLHVPCRLGALMPRGGLVAHGGRGGTSAPLGSELLGRLIQVHQSVHQFWRKTLLQTRKTRPA